MRKQFYLHKRPREKGKPIFYVSFPGANGSRSTALSTGQTSKTAAENLAREFLAKGGSLPMQGRLTFGEYAEKWWTDECDYIAGREARVHRSYLTRYLIPQFGNMRLTEMSARMVEEWLMGMYKAGRLTPATCNRCLGILSVMMKEAVRLGYINGSPTSVIEPSKETPKPRGVLSPYVTRRLFDPETAVAVWGDARHFTANLLSESTGMRLGEVQGLQVQHVHPGWVNIVHSWDDTFGLTKPKWDSNGQVPIPTNTA